MSQKFKKSSETSQEIPLASMPDIIFMLLIFFMVTTVLRETEVMVRTNLPEAEAIDKIEQKRRISVIWIGPERLGNNQFGDTQVQIDDDLVDIPAIRNIMYSKLQEQPRLIVSMRVDGETEMNVVNQVQEELREAGTRRINYSSTRENP
jgi:biopolymer transport protein ExbD